jgi:hypothetical protein
LTHSQPVECIDLTEGFEADMNKLKVAIGSGAIMAAAVAVTPVFSAQASLSQCPSAKVCLWQNNNYSGDFLGWRSAGFPLENISAANDNRTSSTANKSTRNARWYQLAGGDGFCVTMPAGGTEPDLPDSQNDKATSWAGTGGCP